MSNSAPEPYQPGLQELASDLSDLQDRVEDLEDLRELLLAEVKAQGRPGVPWEEAKKQLDLNGDF